LFFFGTCGISLFLPVVFLSLVQASRPRDAVSSSLVIFSPKRLTPPLQHQRLSPSSFRQTGLSLLFLPSPSPMKSGGSWYLETSKLRSSTNGLVGDSFFLQCLTFSLSWAPPPRRTVHALKTAPQVVADTSPGHVAAPSRVQVWCQLFFPR